MLALVTGVSLGALSGYARGRIDGAIMRCLDVLLAFPTYLLAIGIVSALGAGLSNAVLAIALVSLASFARLVRGSVLSVREFRAELAATLRRVQEGSGPVFVGAHRRP